MYAYVDIEMKGKGAWFMNNSPEVKSSRHACGAVACAATGCAN